MISKSGVFRVFDDLGFFALSDLKQTGKGAVVFAVHRRGARRKRMRTASSWSLLMLSDSRIWLPSATS